MKYFLLLITILASTFCFAQNKETDSLLTLLQTAKEDTNKVKLLNRLSEKAGWRIGNYNKALEYADGAKILAEKLRFKKGLVNSYTNIGLAYYYQGNYTDALKNFFTALKITQDASTGSAGDKRGLASSFTNIGNVYSNQGNYDDALKNHLAALKMREEAGDKKGIAGSYGNIGGVYSHQGDYAEALKNHLACMKILLEIGDKRGLVNSYNNVGNVYSNQGNYPNALRSYLASLKTSEEVGDKNGIATVYNNIGIVYKDQGNYPEALKNYLAAVKIREEIGDKKGIAASCNNMGSVYKDQGNYSDALKYQLVSLKMREEIGDKKGIANSCGNLGNVYFSQGNTDTAYVLFKKALNIAMEIKAKIELASAARNLYLISTKTDSILAATANIGSLIDLRKEDLHINYTSLSEQEKEQYFATMQEDFNLQYDFALYHPELKQQSASAYNNALLTKGLTLRSSTAVRTAILSSGDTSLINQYDEWLLLKRQISKNYEAGKDVSEPETKANELERELVKRSTVFSNFDKAKNLDWKQVQASLKPKEAAIEFVHFKSEIDTLHPIKYAALIIKPESTYPEIISLCNEKELEKILGAFQGNNLNYVSGIYGTQKNVSSALYDKVWKPMEQSLQGITTVYYSPSGLLHKISFSALSNGKNIYLCDKYKLNRESSTGKVALPDNINYSPSDKVALIGGVKYNSDTTKKEMWTYLPGTLSETEEINKLLKKKNHLTDYLAASNANEINFKKEVPNAEILHVATHGFFFPDPEKVKEEFKATQTKEENLTFRGTTDYANWSFVNNKNPLMRSGIVLAGANDVWERDPMAEGEDGVLTAQEVSNMGLRKTKLVVLSACETGLGDIKGSEGVYGLQRAFKMAGVNYIIMSLWQVPDRETSEFMINFYKKLTDKKDIKKAFYEAQKEMRKKYDPYYWAAFVLIE